MNRNYIFLLVSSSLLSMEPASQTVKRDNKIKKLYHYIEHDYTKQLDDILTAFRFTPSEKGLALLHAIQKKRINCVAILLGHHNINANGLKGRNHTPLLEAVLNREATMVEWLLICGADPELASPLYNLTDLPPILECDSTDSDQCFISPLHLAQARHESRTATRIDTRIYNMLVRPTQSWQDEQLKERIGVVTESCIEAIKHSDDEALLKYLNECKYTKQLRQKYLDNRLKVAAHAGNISAMHILIRHGAASNAAFQECTDRLDVKTTKAFIVQQFVDERHIVEAKKRLSEAEYDQKVASTIDSFKRKKQKTIDVLNNPRTLLLESLTTHQNIALSLQQRETTGTT